MKYIQKITAITLIFTLIGCSSITSVPHNKTEIYGKTLNGREKQYDNNPIIRSNTNYETKEINRIVKNSENNTLEECEKEQTKDLETVLKILNESSMKPLIKTKDLYAVSYENDQFRIKQSKCRMAKNNLYVYQFVIDSKTQAAKSLMNKIGDGLTFIAISPLLIFGYILVGLVNGVLYLDKVANEK